ncbi:leucyl/phenylalanyl-tRNA--protein transferase [Agaribacterium sp. ZY112]|uniref:leucyl/phenylalanyl-tRNA--protein transferase n=1 Tax=Agaribacterium sp. ZY112 TaxID=3233574 RepID=UPI0035236DF9
MSQLVWLDEVNPAFPPTHLALEDPNGLLAAGGNLNSQTLIKAYQRGIFPWFEDGQAILWWSPTPRLCLRPELAHLNRSLRKLARKKPFNIRVNSAFEEVIQRCADQVRDGQDGTWITDDIQRAYSELHQQGWAHCIEAWQDDKLVGGLYGISIGRVFFGESMFSEVSGASKLAFATTIKQLQAWGFKLIDCQIYTDYLAQFGATEIERDEFEYILQDNQGSARKFDWSGNWAMGEHGFDGSE